MADNENRISIVINDAVASTVAPKLIQIAEASDMANASVNTLKSQLDGLQSSALSSLSSQLNSVQGSLAKTATASQGLVSANVSAAASMGILEGRTLSMNRAAANFVTRILGLGGILQQAFPVIGAIALADVLYQMGSSFNKLIVNALNAGRNIANAFDEIISPLRKSNDELALTNDKLDTTIAKLQHRPSDNGVVTALDEARVMADRLDDSLEKVGKDLDEVLKKNQISAFASLFTNTSATGPTAKFISDQWNQVNAARDRATASLDAASKIKDPKAGQEAVIKAYQDERKAINDVITSIENEYNAKKKLQDNRFQEINTENGTVSFNAPDQTANLTELGKAGHLAQQELRNLDLTMANLTKSARAEILRNQVSDNSAALKQAAKDWKALEAAFVSYQESIEKTGRKPTAQESLSWLQSAKNNPLNADKLSAKEQPYISKIASDDEWKAEQSQRLADQVNEIGLYNNALKEANMLKTIEQEAARRGITLTDQETASLQRQIATIVENKNYNQELESTYQAVYGSQETLFASVQAINTLWQQGKLSRDQYNNSMDATIQKYNDATDAVSKFMREEKQQQTLTETKRGTSAHIQAVTSLEGLDTQLRAPGPNRKSEDEIKAINEALTPWMEAQQRKNAIDQQANALINAQADLADKLAIKEAALKQAVDAGALSQQAANSQMAQARNEQNDQQLKNGTGGNILGGAIADYSKQFTTVAAGIKDDFSSVFKTLSDGFADTLGKALTGSKNLGSALKTVAKEGIGELTSGLIKLGIQELINLAQGTAAGSAATAAGVAQAATLGAAWAAPAFAASVATLGAADATGGAAYAAGLASATALSSIPKLATGTNSLPSDMLIYAHQGERVIPAADNRDLISALQRPMLSSSSGTSGKTHIQIINNGNGRIETQEASDEHIRVIVHAEAPHLIAKHAPGVVANDIANPNSKVSKAISRNVTPSRNR